MQSDYYFINPRRSTTVNLGPGRANPGSRAGQMSNPLSPALPPLLRHGGRGPEPDQSLSGRVTSPGAPPIRLVNPALPHPPFNHTLLDADDLGSRRRVGKGERALGRAGEGSQGSAARRNGESVAGREVGHKMDDGRG